jgi:hypothetical protein
MWGGYAAGTGPGSVKISDSWDGISGKRDTHDPVSDVTHRGLAVGSEHHLGGVPEHRITSGECPSIAAAVPTSIVHAPSAPG